MPRKTKPGEQPSPDEIRAAREYAGLTQTQAGDLVWSALRTWQSWESGERGMHPAIWWAWLQRVPK